MEQNSLIKDKQNRIKKKTPKIKPNFMQLVVYIFLWYTPKS